MKSKSRLLPIILLGALIASASADAAKPEKKLQVLDPAPVLTARKYSDGNKPAGLDDWRGRAVVLNVWATWCVPCLKELPSLDRLSAQLAGDGIAVVGLSEDDGGPAQVKPFLDKFAITRLAHLYDTEQHAFRDFNIRGLPTTFLISPQGRILARLDGAAEWDQPAMVRQIRALLAPPKPAP